MEIISTGTNPKRLIRLYALLLFVLGVVGLIYTHDFEKWLFLLAILAALGLSTLKKWGLILAGIIVIVCTCIYMYMIWFDPVTGGFYQLLDMRYDGTAGIVVFGFLLYTALYFALFVLPIYIIWKKRDIFS